MNQISYNWTLKDAIFTKDKGRVFSCFSCGGGSTMGYKLAGFDVLGCNEIDPKMLEVYKLNHNPKYSFLESIQHFKLRDTKENLLKAYGSESNIEMMGGFEKYLMPEELFNLDILDGSPPCSSFSMSGNRDKDWGKEKIFREGQAEQILDTLFFDFIDLAKKLKPKVVVAENVKGLLMGSAKSYVRRIYKEFEEAGYYVQHFLLDSSTMGVPQRRERVFFIALRKDLGVRFLSQVDLFTIVPTLELNFNQEEIPYKDIEDKEAGEVHVFPSLKKLLPLCKEGQNLSDVHPKGSMFNYNKVHREKVLPTITAHINGGGLTIMKY